MGRWRAAASNLLNHLMKTPFPSPKPLSPRPLPSSNPPLLFRFTRHFSALPSPVSVYATDFDNGSPEFAHQNHGFVSQGEEEKLGKITVKAYFLCTRFASSSYSMFRIRSFGCLWIVPKIIPFFFLIG